MRSEAENRKIAEKASRRLALEVARYAHMGQKDKGGRSYVDHPVQVMCLLEDPTEEEKMAALLHDVVEDSFITLENLRQLGFSEEVVGMVDLLTRPKGLLYFEWIEAIKKSGNKGAIKVKIADLKHNLNEKRFKKLDRDLAEGLKKKYEKALSILLNEIYCKSRAIDSP